MRLERLEGKGVLARVLREGDGTSLHDAGKDAPVGALGGELCVEAPVEGLCSYCSLERGARAVLP
ncbi:hypothetical protein Taro_052934 [Colocasia esculenta]|uniref:Uncharacterized protein n=1 Tax=Colocasia esculenta TaxID=4460 RepID=A0A843XL40_COLES|nr:hypothetical protein [Colocasia esculenta]